MTPSVDPVYVPPNPSDKNIEKFRLAVNEKRRINLEDYWGSPLVLSRSLNIPQFLAGCMGLRRHQSIPAVSLGNDSFNSTDGRLCARTRLMGNYSLLPVSSLMHGSILQRISFTPALLIKSP